MNRIRWFHPLVLLGSGVLPIAAAWGPPTSSNPKEKDKELSRRLIRKSLTDRAEDRMTTLIHLMNQASHKLEIEFDAGVETQVLQKRILNQLDEAIKVAASRRRLVRSRRSGARGDKRRATKGLSQGARVGTPSQAGKRDSKPAKRTETGGKPTDHHSTRRHLLETRRAWGLLPMREREEIIQGAGDGFLERYRDWIERYYRSLQETNE